MEAVIADTTALVDILQLFKRRDVDVVKRPECRDVIPKTNQLLQQGLLPALLKSIKTDVNTFCNRSPTANGQPTSLEGLLEVMRLKADIVFFASYQSQLLENEATDLVETLRILSNLLLTGVPSGQSQSQESGIDWCPSVYSLLVVLQLAHVCALQQTTCLLSRNVDYTQPLYQQCSNIEDVIEVGNSLPQVPGSRCAMDVAPRAGPPGHEAGWLCDGARGFACLAFAVLRQPEVDMDHAPASDVEWFLHEACRMRAYSYIRLCMLPVLQAAYLQDRDTTLFYVAVLCELLENLAKMFCMTHYKQVHAHNENDFPYAFFPPTGAFYADNMAFYADRLSAAAAGQQRLAPAPAVDSLEDVLSVYSALLELRPEFAHAFWPSSQSHDVELQRRQQGFAQAGGMGGTTEHHDIVDHYYHPFVMKAVDASFHHPELMICAIRFVAALSSSPLGRTAYAGYLFVQDSSHHRFTWDHFFESMDAIALQLGASLSASAASSGAGAAGAAGSYSASLSGFSQQQALQLQLSQAHFSLSEKDAEGLVAIMRLLAAVAVHPAAAALLHETHRPVPRLFALLSCALPITLKGAILKALSVFARGSATVSEEVWQLVEAHRLLPITSAPLGTSAGSVAGGASAQSFGARKAGVQGRGLRVELEEAESRAGRYPVTEGFLLLLEALLSHGVPDSSLGLGYRRPGLMVYLDYVVEEVLLKCQDRPYLPGDWPSARAQRWRITALCLGVLHAILQHYPINCIPADSVAAAEELLQRSGSTVADAQLLRDVVADFRDQLCEYSVEGSVAPQRMSRPKSAAFVLMAQLLGRARLFDYLGYVLLECSGANIERSFDEHCVSEIGAAVDLLQTQYQLAHPSSAPAKHDNNAFDFAFPTMGTGSLASTHRQTPQVAPKEEAEPLDLTSLGREVHLCDPVFWQERSVAAAVGLVYECALREGKFMTLLRSAPSKLTITRVSEQGRVAVLPVVAHGLSELLCADRDSGMLSLIAQVVPTHVRSCPCLPSVNVLAVRILEHVTLHLPASRLLAALVPAAELAIGKGFQQPVDRAAGAGSGWFLMKGCADALRNGAGAEEERSGGGTLHYDALCMGGVAYPGLFSLSAAYTRNATPPNLYLTMVNADSNEEAALVDAEFQRALRLGGTIREAVLSLLLRTLTPANPTLSHQLLGLAPSAHGADAVSPEGCLDAVIHLLSPASAPLGTTFIQQSPEQACDCFELLYRLCASPLSSAAVLRRLGDRKVDFLRAQLTLLVYLIHLSDDELLQGADLAAINSAGGSGLVNPSYTALHSIKTALHSSAAWLLKTCVLYLRFAELNRSSATTTQAQQLLELLCTGCDALPFRAERGDAVAVLEKLLQSASSFPPHPYSSTRPSAALQQCLEAAAAVQRPSKAGTGWGDSNPFFRQDAAHADALTYPVVDLRLLSALLQASGGGTEAAEVEEALSAAVLLNVYHKSVAAGMHFCLAWCQLVSMIAAGGKTQQLLLQALGAAATDGAADGAADRLALADTGSGDFAAQAAAARRLVDLVFEQLFLPTSAVLVSGAPLPAALSRALYDQLVRCLVAQVRVMLAPLSTEGTGAGEDPVMLLPDQYLRVLEVVTQQILQHRKSLSPLVTAPLTVGLAGRSTTASSLPVVQSALSSAQQGMLAAALVHLLRAPVRLLRAEDASAISSWSQESKSPRGGEAEGLSEEALLALECVQGAEAVLSRVGGELVDALGRDSTLQGGTVAWRLSSLAALTAVVECLAARKVDGLHGTLGLARSAQLLVSKGHLHALLDAALAPSLSMSSSIPFPAADSDALLLNTVSLCCQLAGCAEGAEALLGCGIMARLVALDHFANPPPLPDEIAYFATEELERSRAAAVDRLMARFGAVLGLISCLATVAPASQEVATGIAQFINKNQVLVTQLLRMRYLTLTGLALTEGLVALLAQLAAVPVTALTQEGNLLELLGPGADSLVADVCTLLGVLGKSPLPSSLFPASNRPVPGESWWDRIQPSLPEGGDGSYEMGLHRSPSYFPAIDSLPADWSAFDARKLRLSLLLLAHCTSFLRLVTSPQRPATAQRALRAVNAAAVAEAFCQCVSAKQRLAGSSSGESSTRAWLQSPQPVQPAAQDREEDRGDPELTGTLCRLAEGLICVVHNCALADAGQLAPVAAQRVVEAAERFPSHSFTRQVARWVRDLQLK